MSKGYGSFERSGFEGKLPDVSPTTTRPSSFGMAERSHLLKEPSY